MALVTNISKKVDIPHEKEGWMELKKLSWKQLELAAEVETEKLLKQMKSMGGDILKALQNESKKQEADPAKKYDRAIILKAGIVKWSYDAEVTDKNIETLDEETAEWAFREILGFNKPRTEEEVKNA